MNEGPRIYQATKNIEDQIEILVSLAKADAHFAKLAQAWTPIYDGLEKLIDSAYEAGFRAAGGKR